MTALGGFGQDIVLIREVARDRSRLHDYFLNTLLLKSVLAVPALLVSSAVAFAVGLDTETRWVVLLLGLAVVAELLTMTCIAVFQAYERLVYMPIVLIAQRGATAAVGIAAVLLGAGVVGVSAVYAAISAAAFVLATAILYRRVARPRLRVNVRLWVSLMRVAVPIGLAGVFGTVLFRVDTAILAWFESKAVVGDYGAAFRLFEATLFVSWSVGTAVYPVLSRLDPAGPEPSAVFDRSLKLAVAATLPIAVVAAILGQPLVELVYGPEFDGAGPALVLLAPAIVAYPVAHLAGVLLYARDRQVAMVVVHGLAALANVIVNVALIAAFSLEGAAAATSLTWLALAATLTALAVRASGSLDVRRIAAGPAVAAAAAAVVMALLRDVLPAAVVASAAAYLVVLLAYERRANPDDARLLTDFVRRRR